MTCLLVAGCDSTKIRPGTIATAPGNVDEILATGGIPQYIIGPRDVLSVTVYNEPQLTTNAVTVDRAGTFQLPMVGTVQAAGRSAAQLTEDLRSSLGARYIRNPRVAVNVVATNSQKVTIDGAVDDPGVYALEPGTTLQSLIATANGTTRVAKLSEVAIFRNEPGARKVAVFDLKAIREGRIDDPQIQAGDVVIVGFSGLRQAWRDFLQTVPAIAVFTRYSGL